MVSTESTSYSKRLLHLISWSHWFTFFNIWAAIAFSAIYLVSEPLPDSALGNAYLLSTWLSHMAFLTFVGFMLIVFPLTLLFPYTRFIRSSASVIFTFGLLCLVLDAFIYSRLGYHLNASSKSQIFALIKNQINLYKGWFWGTSVLLFVLVLGFELLVSNYAWKHLKQLQQTRFANKIVIALVSAFIFSHSVHIWADAKLDYNVLKQDTMLPLSYPTTAKALLTKYGLFDRADYMERRNSPLKFTEQVRRYPDISAQCPDANNAIQQSVFLILTDEMINSTQSHAVAKRSFAGTVHFSHHIDNALDGDQWFNLFYSLPSIYQQDILAQHKMPALFQLLAARQIPSSYTLISPEQQASSSLPDWLATLFNETSQHNDIAKLILSNRLNELTPGLHVVHFRANDNYQFELFVDALQLAQRQKAHPDIVWISSIGNKTRDTSLSNKSAFLFWPHKKSKQVAYLTSQMDVMPTLIRNWLDCNLPAANYSTGTDLLHLQDDRVIANTMTDGIMVFNKDKSVFIDQNGNFQSYSRQLNTPIIESADFPLMIDGVHFIKQFKQP